MADAGSDLGGAGDEEGAAHSAVSTADVGTADDPVSCGNDTGGAAAASRLLSRVSDTDGGCPVVDDSPFRPTLALDIRGTAPGCVAGAVEAARAGNDAEAAVYELEAQVSRDGGRAVVTVRARCVAALARWQAVRLPAVAEAAAEAGTSLTARLRVDPAAALLPDAHAVQAAAAAAVPAAWPSPTGPPHVYKMVVATFLGLFPCLVLAGSPAGATVAQAGAIPVVATLTAVMTAVPLVVFFAAPLMALIMQQWMRDENSGEFAWLPRRARFCVERGCITRERLPPLDDE